ncbi:MAG: PQQ-binding-like beta-propeller repeat protein [Planctomycetaceae bacterium]
MCTQLIHEIPTRLNVTRRDFLRRAVAVASVGGIGGVTLPTVSADDASQAADAKPAGDGDVKPSANWPDFRNGSSLRGIAGTSLREKLELKWEREAPDGCQATPAIVDGKVYVAGLNGELQSLKLADGSPIWTYRSLQTDNPKTFIPGFSSPVAVTGDSVLCGDEEGTMHCVDLKSGALRWKHETGALVVGGATAIGELVVYGSHVGKLFGLKRASGELVWEFDTNGPVNGNQAFDGNLTFVSGCMEPVLYVVDTETGREHTRVQLDELLFGTPALVDGILYFGTPEGTVLAVDWKAGRTVWSFASRLSRQISSAPAATQDRILIAARDNSLYCIDRQTGKAVWSFETRADNDNAPVVVGDRVFFGSGDKHIYAVGLADGVERWKYNAGVKFVESSPAVGDEHLVICSSGPAGKVLCFG